VAASQTRAVSSRDPETTSVPSGENATEVTVSACPPNDTIHRPVTASQTNALEVDAVARRVLSGENATSWTASKCPAMVTRAAPLAASQTRAVASLDAVAIRVPSGEKAMA
jgi:hypothetical protein